MQRIIQEETGEHWDIKEVYRFAPYTGLNALKAIGISNLDSAYERWVAYANAYGEGATVFDGVEAVLNGLAHKCVQAVVSAKKREQYEFDMIRLGLAGYISEAVLEEDTENHKPHPEPLLVCMERLGMSKSEVLYVGDSIYDYEAARNAGVDFAYAKWGSVSADGINTPDYILETPSDIWNVLE